jgi:hypothetical protein
VKSPLSVGAALLCALSVTAWTAETPTPAPRITPESTAAPTPGLRESAERHAQRLVEEEPPRFETSIDVLGRTPGDTLESHVRGYDLVCGAAPSGAPTHLEMRELRGGMTPFVDFLSIARALGNAIKRAGPDRYFVYRVHRADGPMYIVREGRIPAPALYAPGATFELLDAFPDKKSAVFYWKTLERGEAKGRRPSDAQPPPPWFSSNCPPHR